VLRLDLLGAALGLSRQPEHVPRTSDFTCRLYAYAGTEGREGDLRRLWRAGPIRNTSSTIEGRRRSFASPAALRLETHSHGSARSAAASAACRKGL
jgi:hypothetical protein